MKVIKQNVPVERKYIYLEEKKNLYIYLVGYIRIYVAVILASIWAQEFQLVFGKYVWTLLFDILPTWLV